MQVIGNSAPCGQAAQSDPVGLAADAIYEAFRGLTRREVSEAHQSARARWNADRPLTAAEISISEQRRERRRHVQGIIADRVHHYFRHHRKRDPSKSPGSRDDILMLMIRQVFDLSECPRDTPEAYDMMKLAVIYDIARLSLDKKARDKAKAMKAENAGAQ